MPNSTFHASQRHSSVHGLLSHTYPKHSYLVSGAKPGYLHLGIYSSLGNGGAPVRGDLNTVYVKRLVKVDH
jgi:hypothetical protein